MADVTEKAVDVAADVAAEIAQQAEGAEKVIRSLNQVKVAYASLGMVIGATVGSLVAFNIAYRRAELKYSDIASEEISSMRQHYIDKATAVDLAMSKTELDEIVREKGYSVQADAPMAVTPPEAVVEAAREAAEEDQEEPNVETDPTRLTVDVEPEAEVRNVFRDAEVEDTWDDHEERRRRSPLKPYVIHRDERDDREAYDGVTFTYYEEDDVLCNERDEVIDKDEREKLIGEANLEKFGHGSGDASIVYIRNDRLEMDVEVVRSPNSYAEEVHGFDPPEIRHSYRRERAAFDDE